MGPEIREQPGLLDLQGRRPRGLRGDRIHAQAERYGAVLGKRPEHLESMSFIGVYKGKQIGADKKSLTLRLVFRDATRTLRREEIDLEVQSLVQVLQTELHAEFRA